jgi:mannose-6-phosphate isomerase-like protein (cupin superfamily)
VFPPDSEYARAQQAGVDLADAWADFRRQVPGLDESFDDTEMGMHTTQTVDYDIVLSGEIWLEVDDGQKVLLEPGDFVIQNGTRHAWRNLGDSDCVMACVMVGARQR